MADNNAQIPQEAPSVLMKTADGQLVPVFVQNVGMASAQYGYVPATAEEAQAYKLQQKYGGMGSALAAAGEGALETLVPGVGPAIEQGLGVPAEDIRGRAEANPTAHTLGQITGVVAPALVSGGAGALAKVPGLGKAAGVLKGAADLTAPQLISRAGAAVGEEAGAAVAKGAAQRIVAEAANQAAQGGLYASMDVLNRAVNEDPKLTAEQAISEVGLGTLIGGAIGGGAAASLGGLGKVAQGISGSHYDSLSDFFYTKAGQRNVKAAGAIQRQIARAETGMSPERFEEVSRNLAKPIELIHTDDAGKVVRENVRLVSPFKSYSAVHDSAQQVKANIGSQMGELTHVLDDALAANDMTVASIHNITDEVREKALKPLLEDPHQASAAKRLTDLLDRYEELYKGDKDGLNFTALHDIRQNIDSDLYGWRSTLDPERNAYSNALRRFRNIVNDQIEENLGSLNINKMPLGTKLLEKWRKLNLDYQTATLASDWSAAGMARTHGNNTATLTDILAGGMTAAAKGDTGAGLIGGTIWHYTKEHADSVLGGVYNVLGDTFSKMGTTSNKAISAGIKSALGGAARSGVAGFSSSELGKYITAKAYNEFRSSLDEMNADPDKLASHLETNLDPLIGYAAPVVAQVHMTSQNAIQYLASIAPRQEKRGPFDPDVPVSAADLNRFNRAYSVVNNPYVVLDHLAKGTLTQDHVNALAAVYPELLYAIQKEATSQLADLMAKGERPPTKVMAGFDLISGAKWSGTVDPRTIQSTQGIFSGNKQQEAQQNGMGQGWNPAGPVRAGQLNKSHFSERLQTPMQRSGNRK